MKKLILSLFILLLLAATAVFTFAQEDLPNDPTVNDNANACFEGGSMEGLCGTVDHDGNGIVDDYELAWDFNCGWYLIRYQYNMIGNGDVPSDCQTLLAYEPDTEGCNLEADQFSIDLVAGVEYGVVVSDNDCSYNIKNGAFYSLSLSNGGFDFIGWLDNSTLKIRFHCVNAGQPYDFQGYYGDANSGPARIHIQGNCL